MASASAKGPAPKVQSYNVGADDVKRQKELINVVARMTNQGKRFVGVDVGPDLDGLIAEFKRLQHEQAVHGHHLPTAEGGGAVKSEGGGVGASAPAPMDE